MSKFVYTCELCRVSMAKSARIVIGSRIVCQNCQTLVVK